jgi:hypothetical protein
MGRRSVAAAAAAIRADTSDLAGLGLLAASFVVLFVAAWADWPIVVIAALVLGVAADVRGERRTPKLFEVFERSRLGPVERQVARDAAVLLLLWRSTQLQDGTVAALGVTLVGSYLVVSAYLLVRQYLQRIRALPIETRNVDLSGLRLPPEPRPALVLGDRWLVAPWAVGALGLILADLTGRSLFGFAGVGVAILTGLGALAVVLLALARARHLRRRGWVFQTTLGALAAPEPEVVLYHSGAPGSAYQINMWLSTMEQLGRPALVLLRQSEHLSELEPTSVPIACVPSASDVMDLDLPSLRLAFYVGNVAENVHLWRNGRLRHVFIGHGDSDKAASSPMPRSVTTPSSRWGVRSCGASTSSRLALTGDSVSCTRPRGRAGQTTWTSRRSPRWGSTWSSSCSPTGRSGSSTDRIPWLVRAARRCATPTSASSRR